MSEDADYRLNLTELDRVNFDEELPMLALRTLGVSINDLMAIYGYSSESSIHAALEVAMGYLRDKRPKLKSLAYNENIQDYDLKPVGKIRLQNLLMSKGLGYKRASLDLTPHLVPDPHLTLPYAEKEEFVDSTTGLKSVRYVDKRFDKNAHIYRRADDHKARRLVSEIVKSYAIGDQQELLFLWPLPTKRKSDVDDRWEVLTFNAKNCDEDGALRLIFALTILGFSELSNRNSSNAIPDIVRANSDLPKHIFACTKKFSKLSPEFIAMQKQNMVEHDPAIDRKIEEIKTWHQIFPENQLLLNQEQAGANYLYPIVLKLNNVRKKRDKCLFGRKPIIRPKQCDKLIKGLMELMLNSSGILCRVRLNLGEAQRAEKESDIRIYAPKRWIKHLELPDDYKPSEEESRAVTKSKMPNDAVIVIAGSATYADIKRKTKKVKQTPS